MVYKEYLEGWLIFGIGAGMTAYSVGYLWQPAGGFLVLGILLILAGMIIIDS